MSRLRINKNIERTGREQVKLESRFELNVPGTGRLRTSCNHDNFHKVVRRFHVVYGTRNVPENVEIKETIKQGVYE